MKVRLLKIVDYFHLYSIFNIFTKNTATIFMLHRIDKEGTETGSVLTAALLREYFEYLRKHHYNVISLTSYIQALINHEDTYKTVIFTVDDGYRDFYHNIYNIFREYNYPATVFITSDFIQGNLFFWWDIIEYVILNTPKQRIELPKTELNTIFIKDGSKKKAISTIINYCKGLQYEHRISFVSELVKVLEVDITGQPKFKYEPLHWVDILEMKENGIEFYPHTKTHPVMSNIPLEQKMIELTVPKKIIEKKLNKAANIFAYPNGEQNDFDEETISALKASNYIAAVTCIPDYNNTKTKSDMFQIHRFALPCEPIWFKQRICGLERFKRIFLKFLY